MTAIRSKRTAGKRKRAAAKSKRKTKKSATAKRVGISRARVLSKSSALRDAWAYYRSMCRKRGLKGCGMPRLAKGKNKRSLAVNNKAIRTHNLIADTYLSHMKAVVERAQKQAKNVREALSKVRSLASARTLSVQGAHGRIAKDKKKKGKKRGKREEAARGDRERAATVGGRRPLFVSQARSIRT